MTNDLANQEPSASSLINVHNAELWSASHATDRFRQATEEAIRTLTDARDERLNRLMAAQNDRVADFAARTSRAEEHRQSAMRVAELAASEIKAIAEEQRDADTAFRSQLDNERQQYDKLIETQRATLKTLDKTAEVVGNAEVGA